MTTYHGKQCTRILFLVFLTLLGVIYTASAKTTASIEAEWQSMQPIRARMLLLIPQDFAEYVFIYSYKGEEIRLPLGQQAVNQLEILFKSAFTSMDRLPVANKSAAMDMISHNDPQIRRYDLVAVPKFENVSYWDRGPEFGFNVEMSLEISSIGTSKMETITGHSASSTPLGGFSPIERLTLAVSYALDAIKGVIESSRDAWSH